MLVVAGEALIDLITLSHGDLKPVLGGSPYNLANALGRLGRTVAYRNPMSTDLFGTQLSQTLLDSGVQLTGGQSQQPTSLAVVQVNPQGGPSYAFYREGVADRDLPPLAILQDWSAQAHTFHVGSLALLPPDGDAWCQLLQKLRAQGVTTSVDMNMRPVVARDLNAYARTAQAIAAQANYLKVSDEDLHAMGLMGDAKTEAAALLTDTTRVVLLTLGAQGAWCFTAQGALFQPAPKVPVVDTVGAGDCFYAGFLACLDEMQALGKTTATPTQEQLEKALRFGSAVTAYNIQRQGCQPPWRKDITI